jgi:hypothetical protein
MKNDSLNGNKRCGRTPTKTLPSFFHPRRLHDTGTSIRRITVVKVQAKYRHAAMMNCITPHHRATKDELEGRIELPTLTLLMSRSTTELHKQTRF